MPEAETRLLNQVAEECHRGAHLFLFINLIVNHVKVGRVWVIEALENLVKVRQRIFSLRENKLSLLIIA